MRSSFRTPPPPEIPDYLDRLEADLRHRVATQRVRSPMALAFRRMMRMASRPILHGAMVMISVFVVATMARIPEPVESQPTMQSTLAWESPVEIEDPSPRPLAHPVGRPAPRFINFVDQRDSSSHGPAVLEPDPSELAVM